jgi:hypothetical protein
MPKASELPASLKPLALRNAIQVRNTNFGSDAEQLITKMREALEALALGRPERIQDLVRLSFNAHYAAAFLFNIAWFLVAAGVFFIQSNNYAGTLAAVVAMFPLAWVGHRAGRFCHCRSSHCLRSVDCWVDGLVAAFPSQICSDFLKVCLIHYGPNRHLISINAD